MSLRDDIDPDDERPHTMLAKSLLATSFKGRRVPIYMFTTAPRFFERQIEYDVNWIESAPSPSIVIDNRISKESYDVKYQPTKYSQLISAEKANRDVLNWLRYFETKKSIKEKKKRQIKRLSTLSNVDNSQDGTIVPHSHILIITGPPGCGKSTLIRVAAEHCHFHIIEINASEDIKSERNQILLQNQLDFKPITKQHTRPLLLLEELDGSGSMHESVLQAAMKLEGRPVIIAVNNLYAQCLKNIRSKATIIWMPPPPASKIINRLKTICISEYLHYEMKALIEIAEISRYDMRTALNTLQFLSYKQPINIETVQLLPVGTKNSTFTPIDVIQQMFDFKTNLLDSLDMLETLGDTKIVASGLLDNLTHIPKSIDPNGHRLVDFLDGLCYMDCAYGDIANLGIADAPKLIGVNRVNPVSVQFPMETIAKDSQINRNANLLKKYPIIRHNLPIISMILNPDQTTLNIITGRSGDALKAESYAYHKLFNISYKKDSFRHFTSEPNIDSLIIYRDVAQKILQLTKYRELMQIEIDSSLKSLTMNSYNRGKRIGETLNKRLVRKQQAARDFWGQKIEVGPTQFTEDKKPTLSYKYNDGFTNAVRRKVYLPRILKLTE